MCLKREVMMSELMEVFGPWAGIRQVCHYLNIDPSELARRTANGEILAREFDNGSVFYPTPQFLQGQVIDGLKAVLDVLATRGVDQDHVRLWLANSSGDLPSYWDHLRAGRLELVLDAARGATTP